MTEEYIARDKKYLKKWESYVSDLMAADHVQDAALYDHEGSLLASSRDEFTLSTEEFKHIVTGFNAPKTMYNQGFTVKGHHYKTFMADGRFGIMGKDRLEGCSVCKTNKLYLVVTHGEKMSPNKCNDAVMTMGDFLRGKQL